MNADPGRGPRRVVCVDTESGLGGSSRSLFLSVAALRSSATEISVCVAAANPLAERYGCLGIPCAMVGDLPKAKPSERAVANAVMWARALAGLVRFRRHLRACRRLIEARGDIVHFNLDAQVLTALWVRRRTRMPFVMHMRSMLPLNRASRWHVALIDRTVDHLVFITENEQDNYRALGGRLPGTVIYNPVDSEAEAVERHPRIPDDDRFKIACLSNFAWARGVERFAEIAAALASRGRRDIAFVLAGDMEMRDLPRRAPRPMRTVAARGGTFEDYVNGLGLGDMFIFPGHVSAPRRILAGCDVLAKLSRKGDPWGRDVIEALSDARPVIATGRWQGFVENDVGGILHAEFDAIRMANDMQALADDRARCAAMGLAGQRRIRGLCDPARQAAALLDVWQKISAA